MSRVYIPFRDDMQSLSLIGRKTGTSRNTKYGDTGDTFEIKGVIFEIIKTSRLSLKEVAETKYYQEGFESPEEFINIWKEIHYRLGWTPDNLVWFHEYRRK